MASLVVPTLVPKPGSPTVIYGVKNLRLNIWFAYAELRWVVKSVY